MFCLLKLLSYLNPSTVMLRLYWEWEENWPTEDRVINLPYAANKATVPTSILLCVASRTVRYLLDVPPATGSTVAATTALPFQEIPCGVTSQRLCPWCGERSTLEGSGSPGTWASWHTQPPSTCETTSHMSLKHHIMMESPHSVLTL